MSFKKIVMGSMGLGVAGTMVGIALVDPVYAVDKKRLVMMRLKWHYRWTYCKAWDHFSLRRGWEVFSQVCSACHALGTPGHKYYALVNVTHTEQEVKKIAAQKTIQDIDEEGNVIERKRSIIDHVWKPFANQAEAKAANNGALPIDLGKICIQRSEGDDYLYGVLTGYCKPPKGVELSEGNYYNPYALHRGSIAMPPPLSDDMIEYEDGTPATVSQMAKDVTHFLRFTSQPSLEWNKYRQCWQILLLPIILQFLFVKRHTWASVKDVRLIFKHPKTRRFK